LGAQKFLTDKSFGPAADGFYHYPDPAHQNQLGGDDLSGKVKLKVEPLPTRSLPRSFLKKLNTHELGMIWKALYASKIRTP
jgi:hypothetical protein